MNMWKRICDRIIQDHDTQNREVCLQHSIHYCSDLYTYYLYLFETKKSYHYVFLTKNIFLPDKQKQIIIDMYEKVTTYYCRVRKCIWKYWVSKQSSCNLSDLGFTPFSELSPQKYFQLMDGKKKYIFTHTEMYNIIESSLTNADSHLIANPLSIKNPYTGTIFTIPVLYHIYFTLKHLPLFFIQYMRVGFDVTTFLLENECGLRQYNIHKKVRNLPRNELANEIRYMVVDIYSFIMESEVVEDIILLKYDISFSRELLTHYYNYSYSLNPYQRLCECKTLVQKIKNMSNKIHKNITT